MTNPTRAPAIPAYWQKYIKHVSRKAATGLFSPQDAEQTASMAYLKAERQHNPLKGPFEHYARAAIRKALITGRSNEQRHSDYRAELTDDIAPAEILPPPWAEEEDRLAALDARRAAAHISAWVRRLPARPATICRVLYFEDLSQRAAAARFGLSQARISQLNSDLLVLARRDLAFLA